MNIPQTWKTLLKILALLTSIQLLRIASKALVFSFVERTVWADTLCSAGWMLGALCVFCVWVKEKGVSLSLFSEHFHKGYGIASDLAGAFFIATPLITQYTSPQALLSLVYGAILTVALEELLFRGWVWKQLELLHTGPFPWLVSSVLFGIWHLGYADTVLWRTSLFFPGADVANILFWKVVTGLALGVVFGLLRWRCKNAYAPFLLHLVINTFGS